MEGVGEEGSGGGVAGLASAASEAQASGEALDGALALGLGLVRQGLDLWVRSRVWLGSRATCRCVRVRVLVKVSRCRMLLV